MIKIQYEFENHQEKDARELIDRAKWKDVIQQMSVYMLRQSNLDTIPEREKMIYYRMREKMLDYVKMAGLSL